MAEIDDKQAELDFEFEKAKALAQQKSALPSLGNAARDLAVGFGGAIPGLAALPGVITSGVKAAYSAATSDEGFVDAFKRDMLDPNAQDNIRNAIDFERAKFKSTNPIATPEQELEHIHKYTESAEFEDLQKSQVRHAGVRFAGATNDFLRNVVGDTRKDSERSWVDGALEAIGGAALGVGPTTAGKLAKGIATSKIGSALLANPVSYGALRTAEVLTPVTMPMTPANFALNASAGVVIDEAQRALLGQDTMFSDGDSKLAGTASVATAIGVGALALAAFRGRAAKVSVEDLMPNATPAALDAVNAGSRGATPIKGGPALSDYTGSSPVPALSGGSIIKQANDIRKRSIGTLFDEAQVPRAMIEELHGPEGARAFEDVFSNFTGAGGRDTMRASKDNTMHEFNNAFAGLSPEEQHVFNAALAAQNAEDRVAAVIADYNNRLAEHADLQRKGDPKYDAKKHLEEQDALQRLQADDPVTRRYMPELSRNDLASIADPLSSNPRLAAVRDIRRKMLDNLGNDLVKAGVVSQTDMQALRMKYRDYTPMYADPLDGATGLWRSVRAIAGQFDKETREKMAGNTPLFSSLDKDINTNPNTPRVGTPIDPLLATQQYVQQMYERIYHNTARQRIIDALTKDKNGAPSKYMANNNIERFETQGRVEFSSAEMRAAASGHGNPAIAKVMKDDNFIRVDRNGMSSFYRFGDPQVTALLRFEPTLFTGWAWLAKKHADFYRWGTTGPGAPVYAPINALQDTTAGLALRPADRAFGLLDTLIRRIAGEQWGKAIGGRFADPTAYAALPWHTIMAIGELTAARATRAVADSLAQNGPIMSGIANAIGRKTFEKVVHNMLRAAEQSKTMTMLEHGVMHSSGMHDIYKAADAFSQISSQVHPLIRSSYQFYKDIVNAIHAAPKREFFSQNYSLLESKYGVGKIPEKEMNSLISDTRNLAGNMTRRAGSKIMQQWEAAVPFMAPTRNGLLYLVRGMSDPKNAQYVWPRLMTMMAGVMGTFMLMSNWDDEAKKEFWINTPAWMRYRYLFIPTPELLLRRAKGENPAFSPDLIYKVPIGPDLAPIIAGASAFMRGIGMLPNNPIDTPQSAGSDFLKTMEDAVGPYLSVPTIVAAPLALAGVQVDMSSADSRGGSLLRLANANPFRKGPQSESASNLGEMNSTTMNVIGVVLGSTGQYLARSLDAMVYATKFDPAHLDPSGQAERRSTNNYFEGLKAATTTFVGNQQRRLPDVPLVWKGEEKQYTQTPAQNEVAASKQAMQSITGIRDAAKGPRANQQRGAAGEAGGISARRLTDPYLLEVAQDISQWARSQTNDYGVLKKEYGTLASTRSSLEANYTMPRSERMQKINALIDKMQENMDQQRMLIMFKEAEIKEKYGQLIPALSQQPVTMQRLDQLMRAAIQ